LAAGIALRLILAPGDERATATPDPPAGSSAPTQRPEAPSSPLLPPSAGAPPPAAHDGANIVGPRPDDPHVPGMGPHPMDDARARINAENRLILYLNEAMSFRDVKKMRELVVEYRKLDPKDTDASQAGYTVIADCIETPGEGSLAAARQFYDTQRHSPLRRFVRRICFENSN
jgi:hypothetical protein